MHETHIYGSSTQNTRIERLWVEVGSQFVRRWKVFFQRLESDYGLRRTNTSHIWLLHYLFLDAINADAETFRQDWNSHGVSGNVTQNKSPEVNSYYISVIQGAYRLLLRISSFFPLSRAESATIPMLRTYPKTGPTIPRF